MRYEIETKEEFLQIAGIQFVEKLYEHLKARFLRGSYLLADEKSSHEFRVELFFSDMNTISLFIRKFLRKAPIIDSSEIKFFKIKIPFDNLENITFPEDFPVEKLKSILLELSKPEILSENNHLMKYKKELEKIMPVSPLKKKGSSLRYFRYSISAEKYRDFLNWSKNHLRIFLIGNPIREEALELMLYLSIEGEKELLLNIPYSPLSNILANFRELIMNIMPIGPIRENPLRYYIFRGSRPINVGFTGSKTADLIYANMEKLNKLNKWLKEFQIGYKIDFGKEIDPDTDVYSLKFIDEITGYPVALPDIGFGVSQVLPIFVQTILSDIQNEILLIEQPEIHLNPKLQAELGQFFAKAAQETPNKQFIIETHSEHLILRLKKLIKKGFLSPEQISIVFIAKEKDGAKAIPIGINTQGEFMVDWPDDFFELAYKELFE